MSEFPSYYAIIPSEVRYDSELSSTAKLLYGEITSLCSKYNECWATNEYFSSLYKCSTRQISRLISQLNSKGYIKIEMVYSPNTKNIDKRVISLNPTYGQKCRKGIEENVDIPMEENVQDNNTSMNNTSMNNIPPIIPHRPVRQITDNLWQVQFEKFWNMYPKKDKKALAQEWFKKHRIDEQLFHKILSALSTFKNTKSWKKANGQFIPQAITWLNQKRWEDEIPTSEIEMYKEDSKKIENEEILAELEAEKCR